MAVHAPENLFADAASINCRYSALVSLKAGWE
jgi:hypothetical protein